MNKFKIGDEVRFVSENYEDDINIDGSWHYRAAIGKVGIVRDVTPYTSKYPYDVAYEGLPLMMFSEAELKEAR